MTTFAARLQQALAHAEINVETLAGRVRASHSTAYRWQSGATIPQPRFMREVANATGVREEWLRAGEGQMEASADGDAPSPPSVSDALRPPTTDLVPIYDYASVEAGASPDGIEVQHEVPSGLFWLPRDLVRDLFGVDDPWRVRRITVTGSSMMPTLQPGQKLWVVLQAESVAPVSGAIYLLRGPLDFLLVKRVLVSSDAAGVYRVSLVSDNPDKERYPDEVYALDVFQRDFSILAHVPRAELAL